MPQSFRHDGQLTAPLEVDHIVPHADGGTSTMANLQTLCRDCHLNKTATENKRRQQTRPRRRQVWL